MSIVICNQVGGIGIRQTARVLAKGGKALDAVEAGIRPVEADPAIHSVGRGGWPNLIGEVELDASIMDGHTLRSGSVAALRGYAHPISVARVVMERLPHVLLAGDGAARFAHECQAECTENLTEETHAAWERWLASHGSTPSQVRDPSFALIPLAWETVDPMEAKGTTVFLARDAKGHLAAGVSTSGWAWKYPGRLGDSPIIGAGCYADDRYGAAACIGHGELTIRASTARAVVLYLKMGLSLRRALEEAAADLDALDVDYAGWVTIHALNAQGEAEVLTWGSQSATEYWLWRDGMKEPQLFVGRVWGNDQR